MKIQPSVRYWLSVSLGILALLLAVSALLLWVVFPRGFFPSRAVWVEIHKWAGLVLSAGILFHIVLHWQWLLQMTKRYLIRSRNRKK